MSQIELVTPRRARQLAALGIEIHDFLFKRLDKIDRQAPLSAATRSDGMRLLKRARGVVGPVLRAPVPPGGKVVMPVDLFVALFEVLHHCATQAKAANHNAILEVMEKNYPGSPRRW